MLKHRTVQLSFGPGNSTPIRGRATAVPDDWSARRANGDRDNGGAAGDGRRYGRRSSRCLSFYDGLGSQCSPSYTLAGGDPGDAAIEQQAQEEALLVTWYLAHGNIVTIPDFEGTGLHWMAGRESGYGALDAIRATESYLGIGT